MYQWIIVIIFVFCLWKIFCLWKMPEIVKRWRETGKISDLLKMIVTVCLGIAAILALSF